MNKNTIRLLIFSVLINGYLQGKIGKKLDSSVVEEATKEIEKALKKKK